MPTLPRMSGKIHITQQQSMRIMNNTKVQGRAVEGGDADGGVAEADHQENPALLEQCHRASDQGDNQFSQR